MGQRPAAPPRGGDLVSTPEQPAALLLPGWRHQNTGKLHIRRECRAVQFYGNTMTPVLIRFDDDGEVSALFNRDNCCLYCFAGFA